MDSKLTSKFIDLEKGKIHYHEKGSGDFLLFLHGSGPGVTGMANFSESIQTFSTNFHCIVLDLPGYGQSDPVDGDPIGASVESIIEFLDKADIKKSHIIGNSFGAVLGGLIAAYHPTRVDRFISIGGLGTNIFSFLTAEMFLKDGISLIVLPDIAIIICGSRSTIISGLSCSYPDMS